MKIKALPIMLISAGLVFSGSTFASGTISRPASTPKASGMSSSDSNEKGRMAYMNKVACQTCAMPGGANDMEQAKALIQKIDAGEISLSNKDKKSVKAYLKNRFDL